MPSRKRSPHPGIVVLQRNAHHGPRVRWRDPDTGRMRVQALPVMDLHDLRKWLIRKSLDLTAARIATEPPPGVSLSLDDAVKKYFREVHRLRPATLQQYRYSTDKFRKWAASRKLRNIQDINLAQLRVLRAHLNSPGRAVASVNRDLTHVAACLEHLRTAGDIRRLSADDISTGLKRLPSDFEKKKPLTLAEVQELMLAMRPAEPTPQGDHGPGPVPLPRYRAFVLTLLLTGMRATECLKLKASSVDIPGRRIVLTGSETKTRRGRSIDLSVSPSLLSTLADFKGWDMNSYQVRAMRERLHPSVTFQVLRVTCGTYLTCAPGIYGGASAYMSAKRLGHSVQIAESNYVGEVQVDPAASTLEAALGLCHLLNDGSG